MGTIRTYSEVQIMTHYFSTEYEATKSNAPGGPGWYYQHPVTDPTAKMLGPFRLLEHVQADAYRRLREGHNAT